MSVVRSMTGFASVEDALADGRGLSVRVKSVNARHLEMQVRLPAGLDGLEQALRVRIKAAVRRGHVEMSVFAERGSNGTAVHLDEALLAGYVDAYRRASAKFSFHAEPDLHALLRIPGVLSAGVATGFDAETAGLVERAAEQALQQLQQARETEGAALARELRAGAERLTMLVDEAGALRRQVAVSAVDRLRIRLTELAGESVEVGPERLVAEAAMLVARGDVEEELVRLKTHLQRFTALLDAGGEVGKPLEFLLQELHREANTLLSKTGGAAGEAGLRLTDLGLAIKVELERAREQIQNLE